MRIRLIRKLADAIDGVDISGYAAGDIISLRPDEARLLIAERYAVPVKPRQGREIRQSTTPLEVAEAADSARRNTIDQLRRASERLDSRRFELPYGRRREDIVLDELHDSRARPIREHSD